MHITASQTIFGKNTSILNFICQFSNPIPLKGSWINQNHSGENYVMKVTMNSIFLFILL